MSRLEARYRRLLRLLPAPYRRAWEEEMVATFLESSQTGDEEEDGFRADYGRPSLGEAASVLGLALRLRLGGANAPERSRTVGTAVRRFALVGLLVHAVAGTLGLWQQLWLTGQTPWPAVPSELQALATTGESDLVAALLPLTGLLWVASYFAALAGHRRTSAATAIAAFVVLALEVLPGTLTSIGTAWWPSSVVAWTYLLIAALVVISLAAFHHHAPPPTPRPWFVAYLLSLAAAGALIAAAQLGLALTPWWVDWPGIYTLALAAAALSHLARTWLGGSQLDPSSTVTLAMLAAVVLALRTATLLPHTITDTGIPATLLTAATIQVITTAALTIVLALLTTNSMRHLDPHPSRLPNSRQ